MSQVCFLYLFLCASRMLQVELSACLYTTVLSHGKTYYNDDYNDCKDKTKILYFVYKTLHLFRKTTILTSLIKSSHE